jgi:hypothetical protein
MMGTCGCCRSFLALLGRDPLQLAQVVEHAPELVDQLVPYAAPHGARTGGAGAVLDGG